MPNSAEFFDSIATQTEAGQSVFSTLDAESRASPH